MVWARFNLLPIAALLWIKRADVSWLGRKLGTDEVTSKGCEIIETYWNDNTGHDSLLRLHRDLESAPTVNRSDGAMAATSLQGMVTEAMKLIRTVSPTWESAVANNVLIFVLGSPLLVSA
ncbi:Uncharacterized protein Rs2_20677 [Raphanus sativus]|nr:Uncharacterized protein Rs2_20677 [Raphanus sativus]